MLEFLKIFFVILIDEIGDKTQLATLGFSVTHNKWVNFEKLQKDSCSESFFYYAIVKKMFLAEAEGFEPSSPLTGCALSKRVH